MRGVANQEQVTALRDDVGVQASNGRSVGANSDLDVLIDVLGQALSRRTQQSTLRMRIHATEKPAESPNDA